MKTKTIKLGTENYRYINGVLEILAYKKNDEESNDDIRMDLEWFPSKYKIGAEVMLISHTNVSPNAISDGTNIARFSVRFDCPDGIGGNSNPAITRYHGWRGTTDDISLYAYGLRKITKIRELKNGTIAVTVGRDLYPDED